MKQKYGTVVGDYNNTMKTTFGFNFIYIMILNCMDTQLNDNKEKLLFEKASLEILVNL